MSEVKAAALHYAAAGLPVLALHLPDGAEGCSCSTPDCSSPGKHPRADLCPHGVKDATTDEGVISSWPDDINIGVALGKAAGGVMVFDVDHLEIAARFLDPEFGLPDQTAVASSGRLGAHIWFRSTGPTQTFHLRAKEGEKIGEVRGDGAYVVVPPSLSVTGRRYQWIGQPSRVDAARFHPTDDPGRYVGGLLADVGAVQIEGQSGASTAIPEKYRQIPLSAVDIPERIKAHSLMQRLRQQLAGHQTKPIGKSDPDRSKRLMGVGYGARDAAKDLGQALTLEECAGIVKMAVIGWYGKYDEGRTDMDYRCWEIAWKAFAELGIAEEGIAAAVIGRPKYDADNYFWDEANGKVYKRIRRANDKEDSIEICNFLPEIIEDIELDAGGTSDDEGERVWRVRFTKPGSDAYELVLRIDDRTRKKGRLEAALSGSLLPSDFIVCARHAPEVREAMQALSTPARRKAFAITGWMDDHTVYVLPGAAGGIAAQGLDELRRIDRDRLPTGAIVLRSELLLYGQGVRPPATPEELAAAWQAFQVLISTAPPRVSVPVVLQVLAGPLASSGIGAVPPLVHIMGKTGILKTSFCLAALSLLGTFKNNAPTPWTSTTTFLTSLLHTAKDLTVLVDDYKRSVVKPTEFTAFIQNYADRTGRGRGNPDGTARTTQIARGLMLSTGEDKWEGEASVDARTIIVPLQGDDVDLGRLSAIQALIQRQELQLFGGAYLTWLVQHGKLLDAHALDDACERWRLKLVKATGQGKGIHLRILGSYASLLAAGEVVVKFVKATFGKEAGQEVMDWIREATKALVAGAEEQAKDIASSSPFRKLATALAEGLAARKIRFSPMAGVDASHHCHPDNAPTAETIGYWEEQHGIMFVLLTKESTYGWYEGVQVRRGGRVGFSWAAVLKEALDEFGGERVERKRVKVGDKTSQLSGVLVALTTLTQEAGSQVSHDSQEIGT